MNLKLSPREMEGVAAPLLAAVNVSDVFNAGTAKSSPLAFVAAMIAASAGTGGGVVYGVGLFCPPLSTLASIHPLFSLLFSFFVLFRNLFLLTLSLCPAH